MCTIGDAVDFINEALVGELGGQWCEQVHVTVKQKKGVEHGQDLSLAARKLPLHPQHHVGHMLSEKTGDRYGLHNILCDMKSTHFNPLTVCW